MHGKLKSMESQKAQTILALFQAGILLKRQNLKRAYPQASEDEIDRHLKTWLETRPGAEQGDGTGNPYTFKYVKL
jgi:Rv0078B-related antitoxin